MPAREPFLSLAVVDEKYSTRGHFDRIIDDTFRNISGEKK